MKIKYISPTLNIIKSQPENVMFTTSIESGGQGGSGINPEAKQSFNDWDDDENFDEDE